MDYLKDRLNAVFKGKEAWQVARDTALGMTAAYYGHKLYTFVQEEGIRGVRAAVGNAVFKVVAKVPGASNKIQGEMVRFAHELTRVLLFRSQLCSPAEEGRGQTGEHDAREHC